MILIESTVRKRLILSPLKFGPFNVYKKFISNLPKRTRIVICGGGISGLSLYYFLLRRGVKDVLLLERHSRAGRGSTSICNSMVYNEHLWEHMQVQQLARATKSSVKELIEKYPSINFKPCERLFISRNQQTSLDLRRMATIGKAFNLNPRFVGSPELEKNFNIPAHNVMRALMFESDSGTIDQSGLIAALLLEIKKLGGVIHENCAVQSVRLDPDGGVKGVVVDDQSIDCTQFVNAAGVWANTVNIEGSPGKHLLIPMHPVFHAYLHLECGDAPKAIVHDMDHRLFLSPDGVTGVSSNAIICGGFMTSVAKPMRNLPDSFDENREQWDQFYPIMSLLATHYPFTKSSVVSKLNCGSVGVSGDGLPLLGELPLNRNCFVLCGWAGHGLSLSMGAASLLADWLKNDGPDVDVSQIDVARFHKVHYNESFLRNRVSEIMELAYQTIGLMHACDTARDIRTSPLHACLHANGAVFGEIMGYERPLFFVNKHSGASQDYNDWLQIGEASVKPPYFEQVAREYDACRTRVALIDMSNFSKFEIQGDEATVVEYLQYLCSANIDVDVGKTVFTGMQNDQGGYFTDCTISRVDKNRFFMVAPTVQQTRCLWWLRLHRDRVRGHLDVQDVTSMYTALNVLGPASRALMEELTTEPMDAHNFPPFSCKEMNIGYASEVRAISVTHTGELGWVLYIPNEFAKHVYDIVTTTGKEYGLKHVGYFTLRNLRMEKFYVYWGYDIDYTTNPFECGRDFRVDLNKGDFKGRDALVRLKKEGSKRRYVQLLIHNHSLDTDPWPRGQEPVYRNGVFCGLTTSASYGFTLESLVCISYVMQMDEHGQRQVLSFDWLNDRNAVWELEIAQKRFPVTMHLHSPQLPMISSEHPTHYQPTR